MGPEFGRMESETTERREIPAKGNPSSAPENPSTPAGGNKDSLKHSNAEGENSGEPENTEGDVPLADTVEAPSTSVTPTPCYPTSVQHPPDQPWFVHKY